MNILCVKSIKLTNIMCPLWFLASSSVLSLLCHHSYSYLMTGITNIYRFFWNFAFIDSVYITHDVLLKIYELLKN